MLFFAGSGQKFQVTTYRTRLVEAKRDLRASLCKILISSFAHKMDFKPKAHDKVKDNNAIFFETWPSSV